MEGIGGVAAYSQVMMSGVEYERARTWMTKEVNAAIEGAILAGANEVYVNEAHDGMRNLLPEELHPMRWIADRAVDFLDQQGRQRGISAAEPAQGLIEPNG